VLRKSPSILMLLVFTIFFGGAGGAQALTMPGPTLTKTLIGWQYSGLSITTLQDVYLTSFVYQNQGVADTVYLEDSSSHVIGSYAYAGSDPSHLITVSWFMQAGQTYHLLSNGYSNGMVASYTAYPTGNAEIQVNGAWCYDLKNDYWFNFNNITTSANPVPLPSAVLLLGSALLRLANYRRRKLASKS
jgi:hypothetical protein